MTSPRRYTQGTHQTWLPGGVRLFASLLLLSMAVMCVDGAKHCTEGQACWPTEQELQRLNQLLNPSINRTLWWAGPGTPYPLAVGLQTPPSIANQPLYGAGKNMAPLYRNNDTRVCFQDNYTSLFCAIALVNNPDITWRAAFVAWPTDASQVQILVNFARVHNLCVSVAGTGHDFLTRHSCNGGLLIRTGLLKEKTYISSQNVIRFGAGITFAEAHLYATQNKRAIASGWSPTVGLAGWTLGGGHGPHVPKFGLGSSQLVEARIVIASGEIVVASATQNAALWRALRGGGGSTWGVLVSLTVKTYDIPSTGFTKLEFRWSGNYCNNSKSELNLIIAIYLNWILDLDFNWGGLLFIVPKQDSAACGMSWEVIGVYHYHGKENDDGWDVWLQFMRTLPKPKLRVTPYPNMWANLVSAPPEPIFPFPVMFPSGSLYDGGVPSVLVAGTTIKMQQLSALIRLQLADCAGFGACPRLELFQDITGNLDSPVATNISVPDSMVTSLLHFVFAENSARFYQLGNNSYFGESAYNMNGWQDRLWGKRNYAQLLETKRLYDPKGLFWCRHCVGDEGI